MSKNVHFIGIGGIGVSALARYYLAKGWRVSGSDLADSEITRSLRQAGANIFIGQNSLNVKTSTDLVIYSPAVRDDNPELKEAKFYKIPTLSYPEALGDLTKQYITLAVSGSHGKSTTTALLSLMLLKAGLDPTIIIGTRLKELGGLNFRLGKSRYLVIEADEWNRSFWHYHPAIAVITNVDNDHLDTYKDLDGVIGGFNYYLKNLPVGAVAIINSSDPNSLKAAKGCKCQIVNFTDDVGGVGKKWPLKIPGNFNQLNAEAAWQAASHLGVKRLVAEAAVKDYTGSWRRLEELAPFKFSQSEKLKGKFFADYAHHPTEIKSTINAIKEKFGKEKIVIVFQPHQVERLTNLFDDFVSCFGGADYLALLPVYEVAGRERGSGKSIEDLYIAVLNHNKINNIKQDVFYLKSFSEAFKLIEGKARQVAVFMGAGNIDEEVRKYFSSKLLR